MPIDPSLRLRAAFPLGGDTALAFDRPASTLIARTTADIVPLLAELDAALAAGRWIAGWLAYEASPALDPALVTRAPDSLPLAAFGIFDAARRVLLKQVLAPGPVARLAWQPTTDADHYLERVARVREAIARGDTYQVNLTHRLRARFDGSAPALLGSMLAAQPVRHAAYVELGPHAICSASPELFFRRRGDLIVCRPMKGTAPRGRFPAEDAQRRDELASSEKERAENLMIVDMVRNDLGRVARAGTVSVPRLFEPERYATLWQLTSTVAARSNAPLSALVAALFPSASVTGAPKPRTMALIADLEEDPRGVYTGAVGFAGPGNRARFNVAIRTVTVDRERALAEYGTGGGVTWDSSAEAELEESRLKARVLTAAPPAFQLLETLRWSPARGYVLLPQHLERLASSARHFGFRHDGRARGALEKLARTLPPAPQRVRLLLARDGAVTVGAEALRADGRPRRRWQVGLATEPVDASEPLLFHKTTARAIYDRARATHPQADDVLLWNTAGELTESTIANLVLALDGALVTPPVESGLLAGTFRRRLLERGRVVERVVRREDLARATGRWLVNSLRGWVAFDVVDDVRRAARSAVDASAAPPAASFPLP